MNKITLEQMIIIAKAGFPESVSSLINYNKCILEVCNNNNRLYCMKSEFEYCPPQKAHVFSLSISNDFVQIDSGILVFNDYKAIKVIEKMGLINE